ncbi:uncharacterized protein LOC133186273 [Saccostrea echinata]|uniref:uncharacterized protein LOC133186273 n=1 Tax=Saccostrea echinata TaxID=191078 RepID=UPI002A83F238|nr:uncharacterized protein LOC133186273 [Saccostrea echinata]
MDPLDRAQVLLLCKLCERAALQVFCELCEISLCKACVRDHLSDSSQRHIIIPYKDRSLDPNYPKCPNHSQSHCNFYCYECDIPACYTCISSGKHHQHKISDIALEISSKTEDLKGDLKELEKNIYFIYEEIASDIKAKKANLEKHCEKLTTAVTKQGEVLHREIDNIVNKQKSEIADTKTTLLIAFNQAENEIKQKLSELDQSILDLRKILESCDVSLTSSYKSKNEEFRILPPKINVSFPCFSSPNINEEKLHQIFGSLSTFSISREKHGYLYLKKIRESASCPPVKKLLDVPELITTIETGYIQISVACLSDEEIWTRGNVNIMKLFNLQGKLLKSIQTKSSNKPRDIAVTRSGELVYTDTYARTVNIVKNEQIQELIRLQRWKPFNVCFSSTGDILVTMDNDKKEQSRVVRYSGSTEKKIIQFDSEGIPLYSYDCLKYMSENRNLDICVADNGAKAVVVVTQAGKLRFRYTGNPSTTTELFEPLGITTDSQGQILTSDGYNFCIHILDQYGQFLRYIENCHLNHPLGLCVDTRDNLFVVELLSGKVKKIKYLQTISVQETAEIKSRDLVVDRDLEPRPGSRLSVYKLLSGSHVGFVLQCDMDPLERAQVLLLCDLCQTAALQSHCELCHVSLCIDCVGEHLSDSSKRHNVVPYKHRTSTPNYPKCQNHTQKHCELYCEKCDIPVCSTCISTDKHQGHKFTDILQKPSFIKEILNKDLKELEKRIYPTYVEIASDLNSEKVNLDKHYENLTTSITEQGEDWHREINIIVNKQKSEIDEMKNKHLAALNKKGKEIEQILSDVKQSLFDLKRVLNSNDATLISGYKSRNAEFRTLPPKFTVSLPSFSPHQINTEQLHQMFGSLLPLLISTEDYGYTITTPEAVSCSPVKPLLDEPELITSINTGYGDLRSATCLSDEEIWTRGYDKIMKLYNLQGKLLKSIQTKSGNIPYDIAVLRSGDLVHTDPETNTVNLVKNKQIQEVIRLQGWRPYNICSTSSGDLLVIMVSDDDKQSKVVRYSGFKEKQTIQFDSKGQPLYSTDNLKYINENRNLDICVADFDARAVVVVNQAGKLRFRYTGHPSTYKQPFYPTGITTDSQSQILTADFINHCIRILDQDGQFLRYIDNCYLDRPWGLCVDTKDNLFVAQLSGGVKKIKYM